MDFKERGGNRATIYKMNSVVSLYGTQMNTQTMTQTDIQIGTKSVTQSVNILKTKNQKLKTKNKKEIIKEKFGEFENVLLSADELQKLRSKLGAETESYIERLSSYIASSGKRYKSHYATILSWTQKDAKNSGGVSYGSCGKKLCTEYPE